MQTNTTKRLPGRCQNLLRITCSKLAFQHSVKQQLSLLVQYLAPGTLQTCMSTETHKDLNSWSHTTQNWYQKRSLCCKTAIPKSESYTLDILLHILTSSHTSPLHHVFGTPKVFCPADLLQLKFYKVRYRYPALMHLRYAIKMWSNS